MKRLLLLVALAALAANAQAQSKPGAPEKAQVCAACHGPDGNEPKVPGAAKIAGQHPDYLYHTLLDYKAGRRKNAIMNGQAQALTDQEMRALAQYYGSQPGSLKVIR
jgi:cytochrome c553